MPDSSSWPELPLDAWLPTYQTLHMWIQVVGKVRAHLKVAIANGKVAQAEIEQIARDQR